MRLISRLTAYWLGLISSDREDSHPQSLRLFASIPSERRYKYIVLSNISTISEDTGSEGSSARHRSFAPTSFFPAPSQENVVDDARLQADLYNVWDSFKTVCQLKCKSERPPVLRYVVEQELRFEADYKQEDNFFTFRYTGPELLNRPFRAGRVPYKVDYRNTRRRGFGQGLMGILTKLSESGSRIRVRLWHERPLDSGLYDREGNPLPGFWWPCQFCNVSNLGVEDGKTFYGLTFIHAPITRPHEM